MSFELILILVAAAFFIGLAKAGFSGVSLISVFLLTEHFGAKEQVGVALPMLIMADLIVYPAYKKYGSWKPVFPLLWPALVGVALAVWVLHVLPNDTMRSVIGWIILFMVALQLFRKWAPVAFDAMAHSKAFSVSAGVSGGVATMLANAAGPIMQLYLLSKNFKKLDLMGVSVRFFLIINILKLPLTAGMSLTTVDTLKLNFMMLPVIALGVLLGKKLMHIVPQKLFEAIIVITAVVAGVRLLVG